MDYRKLSLFFLIISICGITNSQLNAQSAAFFCVTDCEPYISYRQIVGVVTKDADLSQRQIALFYLEQAAQFANNKCPANHFENISVSLFQGDISSFDENVYWPQGKYTTDSCDKLKARFGDSIVKARNYDSDKLTWGEYSNIAEERVLEIERSKQEAELQKQQAMARKIREEEQRRAEEIRLAEEIKKEKEIQFRIIVIKIIFLIWIISMIFCFVKYFISKDTRWAVGGFVMLLITLALFIASRY